MAQDVEAARRRHLRRHRPRVVRIEHAERRLQSPIRDAGLRVHPAQIENAHAGRFAAGAGRRRNRDQRLERTRDRQALADRRIHVVEKVRGRIRRVEVDGLRGVDRRSAADGDERVVIRRRARSRSRRGTTRRSARRERGRRARTGSCWPRANRSPSAPAAAIAAVGSVTTSTFFAPSSARSMPTSRVTPSPKRMDETAISNAVSWVMKPRSLYLFKA